jgi:hypothetical protein
MEVDQTEVVVAVRLIKAVATQALLAVLALLSFAMQILSQPQAQLLALQQ